MNIRFYHARLLTMQQDCSIQEDGELWVKGNRIEYAGPPKESHESWDREPPHPMRTISRCCSGCKSRCSRWKRS